MKKLKLRSETVRMLTDNTLNKIVGGTTSDNTATFCGGCGGTQHCWGPTDAPGGCASETCIKLSE
jgi:hypothetical protein